MTGAVPFGFVATEELPGGHCSRVYADATRVLKVPFQGEEMDSGYWAALALQGRGGPRVLAGDPLTGAVLMERVVPGTKLSDSSLDEPQRREVFLKAVLAMRGLSREHCLPLSSFYHEPHPLLAGLLASAPEPVFLHGDLHPENLLLGPQGSWVTIDPKGLFGDPAFEAVAWLRNPLGSPLAAALLDDRLAWLESEFGWPTQRMIAWALVDLETDEGSPELIQALQARFRA